MTKKNDLCFFFSLNNSFQWQQPIRQNMSMLVVTEAITFHQHFTADDSIFQQAICTWQMVLALSQWGFGITLLIRKLSGKHTLAEKTVSLHSSKANTQHAQALGSLLSLFRKAVVRFLLQMKLNWIYRQLTKRRLEIYVLQQIFQAFRRPKSNLMCDVG